MRLRPGSRVLDRGDGSVQVGVRSPLVLTRLTAEERRFVERLETSQGLTAKTGAKFGSIVAALADADLLAASPAPSRTVAINDGGPLGVGIGTAMARAGWAVRFQDDGPASASPPHTYASGALTATRQTAAADAVARSVPGADARAGVSHADAWVLTSHGASAIDAAARLMASDTPHVFVVTDERGAVVGPVVVPGESACGLCDGLSRVAEDPAWPILALQLRAPSVLPPRAAADVTASVAGLVCGALGAWRAGGAGPWLDRSWAFTEDAPPVSRGIVSDPDCGCGAAGEVGDEVAARRSRFT